MLRTLVGVLDSPLTTAFASDLGPAETRGSQLSTVEISEHLGFGIGPLVGGLFFEYGFEFYLWPGIVGLCLAIAVGLLALEARLTPGDNGSAVPTAGD